MTGDPVHAVAGLNLDGWGTSPSTRSAGASTCAGSFILAKLQQHDAAKPEDVLGDLYRDALPDHMDITKSQWHTILAYMGASEEEIADRQARMARQW